MSNQDPTTEERESAGPQLERQGASGGAEVTTICGHDRETLRNRLTASRLRSEGLDIDGALECHLNILTEAVSDPSWLKEHATKCAAIDVDIHDPAKLAAIITELMRNSGRTVRFYDQHEHHELGSQRGDMVWVDEYYDPPQMWIDIAIKQPPFSIARAISMPKARAFALALLDAPNATLQDVERMIGEL